MPEARATQPVDNWYTLIMYLHGQLPGMRSGQLPGPSTGLHLNTADKKGTASKLRTLPDPPWTRHPQQTNELDNFAKGEVIWLSMLVGSLVLSELSNRPTGRSIGVKLASS